MKIRIRLDVGPLLQGVRLSEYFDYGGWSLRSWYYDIEVYFKRVLARAPWVGHYDAEGHWCWDEFPVTIYIDCEKEANSRYYNEFISAPEFFSLLKTIVDQEDARLKDA